MPVPRTAWLARDRLGRMYPIKCVGGGDWPTVIRFDPVDRPRTTARKKRPRASVWSIVMTYRQAIRIWIVTIEAEISSSPNEPCKICAVYSSLEESFYFVADRFRVTDVEETVSTVFTFISSLQNEPTAPIRL